ncbi:MAG: rhodanese-like domain-containing protein [Saprospiraceae bacterium]|nr:rhodanese-like domain-containing protein [Saprospiraceae bacterium]
MIKSRLILAAFIIPLGLIIAAVPKNTTQHIKLSTQELLDEIKDGTQFVHPDEIADMLIKQDPLLQLIDVRSQDEFEKFSLPGAINIPLADILSEEWVDYIDQGQLMNVFYCNGTSKSNEAWLLTRQLGYQNNYVLQGGLNYWVETILNPFPPANTSPDDEIAKYDFRKGASQAFGGGAVDAPEQTVENTANKPSIKPKKKKKKVQGGC